MPNMRVCQSSGALIFSATKEEKAITEIKEEIKSELEEVKMIREELQKELEEIRNRK